MKQRTKLGDCMEECDRLREEKQQLIKAARILLDEFGSYERKQHKLIEGSYWSPTANMIRTEVIEQLRLALEVAASSERQQSEEKRQ